MTARRGRKKGSGKTKIEIDRYLGLSNAPEEVLFKLNELLYGQQAALMRKNPRIPVSLSLVWKCGDAARPGSSYTLSREGMFIKTAAPMENDSEIEVSFLLPGDEEPVLVSARVVRKVGPEEAHQQGLVSGMAVTFQNVSPGILRRLDHFIGRQLKKKAAPIWV